jgi:hypothetical protein
MGTQASEGSGNQVFMDDFKTLESSVTSQISELHEMIAQLMQTKTPSAPPLPDKPATPQVENEGLEVEVADKGTEAKSSTKGNGKGEFPHWYSPDPLIPHPHINNRGDPPKLDAINWSMAISNDLSYAQFLHRTLENC